MIALAPISIKNFGGRRPGALRALIALALAGPILTNCVPVTPPPTPAIRLSEGAPVHVDGRLSPREWADAQRISLAGGQLLSKLAGGKWLLGVRLEPASARYVDLYVRDAGGRIINLHASLQQGERELSQAWTDETPPYRWGASPNWRTSTAPRSILNADAAARSAGLEGYEMELPLAHLGRCPVRVRVEIRDFFGKEPDWVFPPLSSRAEPAGWAPLGAPC